MNPTTRALCALLFALSIAAAAHAEAPAPDAARGKALFMKAMCYTCHGTEGQGSSYGPKLAPHPFPREGFERQVRHPRSVMPRYPVEAVNDRDLDDIYAYIASIPPGKDAKDIALLRK